eukprot:363622-Chlamydomonas_euryale.AAC.4
MPCLSAAESNNRCYLCAAPCNLPHPLTTKATCLAHSPPRQPASPAHHHGNLPSPIITNANELSLPPAHNMYVQCTCCTPPCDPNQLFHTGQCTFSSMNT